MTPSLQDIDWVVSRKFSMAPGILTGRQRRRAVAVPRFIAFQLGRETGKSLPKIGNHFGRDHTTVLSGVRRLAVMSHRYPEIGNWLIECRDALADVAAGRETAERGHVEALHRGEVSWPVGGAG